MWICVSAQHNSAGKIRCPFWRNARTWLVPHAAIVSFIGRIKTVFSCLIQNSILRYPVIFKLQEVRVVFVFVSVGWVLGEDVNELRVFIWEDEGEGYEVVSITVKDSLLLKHAVQLVFDAEIPS